MIKVKLPKNIDKESILVKRGMIFVNEHSKMHYMVFNRGQVDCELSFMTIPCFNIVSGVFDKRATIADIEETYGVKYVDQLEFEGEWND